MVEKIHVVGVLRFSWAKRVLVGVSCLVLER